MSKVIQMSVSDRRATSSSLVRVSAGLCGAAMLLAMCAGAQAGESSAQLLTAFQTLCMAVPLDFAKTDQKAVEMQFSLQQNMSSQPDESGFYTRSKSYSAVAATPYELVLNDTHGPKGDFKSCGIRATEADAADFKAELTKTMKLGKPVSEDDSDGMSRHTVWTLGEHALTFTDKSPQKMKQGVRLLLSNKPL
jgi:hypothetical protein